MIYRHVFVVRSVLDTIREEVRRAPFMKETGGPLVGYISSDGAIVATHAAGPGPRATLGYRSVVIDGKHSQRFCDHINGDSGGTLDYVGDWHLHPGFSLRASTDDINAMREMAAFPYYPITNPISLIYRSFPSKFVVFVLDNKGNLYPVPAGLIDHIPEGPGSVG